MADQNILGDLAVVAWPDELDALTAEMRGITSRVDAIAGQFRSDTFEGNWTGQAAEAFHGLLKDADGDLGKVITSYRAAASALSDFSGPLRSAVGTADSLAAELADATSRESAAQARLSDAQRRIWIAENALRAAHVANDPVGQATAQRQLQTAWYDEGVANASLRMAQGEKASMWSQAQRNRAELESALNTCCSRLDDASNLGLKNSPLSWIERHADEFGKALETLAHDLVEGTKILLDVLNKVLDVLSIALTVLAVIVAVAIVVLVPELAWLLLPALYEVWQEGEWGIGVAKLGVDEGRFLLGDATLEDLGVDAIGLIPGGAASKAGEMTFRLFLKDVVKDVLKDVGLKFANDWADTHIPVNVPRADQPATHLYDVNANGVQLAPRQHLIRSRATRLTRRVPLPAH